MFMTSGYSAQTRSSATEHHHLAADVLRRGGDRGARKDLEAGLAALVLERGRVEAVEPDDVLADLVAPVDADALAQALEDERAVLDAHGGGPAGVHDAA